jgi:hypothetical protein
MEAIQQTFNGNVGYGNTVTCQISRNGDLINRMYLQVSVPKRVGTTATDSYVNFLGLRLIKSVVIEIGGQQIDKHYSDWLYIWNELSLPIGKRYAYETMVGADKDILSTKDTTLYIPLEFWFCRNVGLSLPLIALQYHEVKVKIEFESKTNCIISGTTAANIANITTASLWVDYIFLDTDERRRFAQLSHEYLIEQLQFTGSETLNKGVNRIKLNFNHPCKELIWVAKSKGTYKKDRWYDYNFADAAVTEENAVSKTSNIIFQVDPAAFKNPLKSAILQLNGNDRFAVREGLYFTHVQPYQHHTNVPVNNPINVYSFALKPEEHQPSGTLNMSRIDTATLMIDAEDPGTTANYTYDGINIYAVNYNVLRILSGMGGLAYSN